MRLIIGVSHLQHGGTEFCLIDAWARRLLVASFVNSLALRRIREWTIACAAIAILGLFLWPIKTEGAQEVSFTNAPASQQIQLVPGKACIIRLPSGKTVALWAAKASGIETFLGDGALVFNYGEQPFKQLESEEIQLPGGGMTFGEYRSYIRQGPVISSGNRSEYLLYVDTYCLSIVSTNGGGNTRAMPLTLAVRQATEKELIPKKQEREHYLQALHSTDPKIRFEAIHELGEMVSLGSIYAGNPSEIANAIRPFLQDQDEEIRKEALARLRVMGDDETLLQMLTPRPTKQFSEPNGAWTIAGWCRKDSDRVPKHVMTFLETEDPKLQEFALAFFSCYRLPYPPAQPYVVKYLKSTVPEVRAAAASAIRFTCDRTTASSMVDQALADPSDNVLLAALSEANWFNDSISIQPIILLLKNQNPKVREAAANALDGCQNPAAVDPLLLATRDNTAHVRAQAAVTLGRIGDAKAYGRLLELLKDPDAEVRESAVNGLRWLGRREAIEAISALAEKDPSDSVKQMARRTVRELKQK